MKNMFRKSYIHHKQNKLFFNNTLKSEKGEFPSLSHPYEATSAVFHLGLGLLAQKWYRVVGVGSEDSHKNGQKAEDPLLWRKTEKAGLVQFGEDSWEI